ncbi:unnamed protein product [Chrysoparadoxa australica]
MLFSGVGVVKDYAEAARHFEMAASGGDTDAMNSLGIMFEEGKGVEKDWQTAQDWYREASSTSPYAALNLGLLLESGDPVALMERIAGLDAEAKTVDWSLMGGDLHGALEAYQRAADLGSTEALDHVGRLRLRLRTDAAANRGIARGQRKGMAAEPKYQLQLQPARQSEKVCLHLAASGDVTLPPSPVNSQSPGARKVSLSLPGPDSTTTLSHIDNSGPVQQVMQRASFAGQSRAAVPSLHGMAGA